MAKNLTACQKRCQDCTECKIKNGLWTCEECFGKSIEEIDDCPNGYTLDQVEEINANAEAHPMKNVARSETKKERKPRERKPDIEKETIIAETAKFLEDIAESVEITNISKIIEFNIGENHYKFDLIRQRKPKNQ